MFAPFLICVMMIQTGQSQNLATNGGFENYTSLPNGFGQWHKCVGWSNLNNYIGFMAPYASPDYIHVNGTVNPFATVFPHSGNAYMGFAGKAHSSNYREYISVKLTTPMIIGNVYRVSFWITNGVSDHLNGYSCDHIGVRLTTTPIPQTTHEPVGGIPQYEIPGEVWDTSWAFISHYMVADSAYDYITIGNFYNDLATSSSLRVTNAVTKPNSYYFVDDVSVLPFDTLMITGDSATCFGDTVTLSALGVSPFKWANSSNPGQILSTASTLNVSPSVTTTYLVYGTFDTASYTVHVHAGNQTPSINLGNDTTLCSGQTLLLDATAPNGTYIWQDNSVGPTLTVTSPGLYWVQSSNICGDDIDSVYISYSSLPLADLGNDTSLCLGQTIVLDASSPDASAYLWQNNSTNPLLTVSQQGTYSVVVANMCGIDTDTIDITFNALPTLNLGNDTALCEGQNLLLNISSAGSYLWQDNSTGATFNVSHQGTFWATVELNNCSVSDTIVVAFNPLPVFDLGNDTNICEGYSIQLDAMVPGGTYLWQNNSTDPFQTVSKPGVYSVTVTTNSCSASDNIVVKYSLLPKFSLGLDTSMCIYRDETILLEPVERGDYLWSDNTTRGTFSIREPGEYWLKITNSCGSTVDTILVASKLCYCSPFVPNAFSPDGDGLNEKFGPFYGCDFTNILFSIYNRWGELLFRSSNPNEGWDGTFDGTKSPSDVYIYILEYGIEGVEYNRVSGHVTLLR